MVSKKNKTKHSIYPQLCISLTTIFGLFSIISIILIFLVTYKQDLIIPTTTKTNLQQNYKTFNSIGQPCQYNNQCPEKAYCQKTCKCPLHYYQDLLNGNCTQRKTFNISCSSDYECNINVGLKCVNTVCLCDSNNQFWNNTFVVGNGIPIGRCQNKKVHGMACSGFEGATGVTYTGGLGAQTTRCICNIWGWNYLNIAQGRCQYANKYIGDPCLSNDECNVFYSMCADTLGDGIKKCTSLPIYYFHGIYRGKQDYNGTSCNANTYICNEWKNLVCRNPLNLCQCYDDFYYYNSTMCVYGKRYGETCTLTSTCVPSSAGFICDYPYTSASYKICICNTTTQYYDITTKTCKSFKLYNSVCNDNSECFGSSSNNMYCGYLNGGTQLRCLCTDAYYSSTSSSSYCSNLKSTYLQSCTNSTQCYSNLNQICSSNKCSCSTSKYYNSIDSTCYQLKYLGDSCNSGNECWSGTCSSTSVCT